MLLGVSKGECYAKMFCSSRLQCFLKSSANYPGLHCGSFDIACSTADYPLWRNLLIICVSISDTFTMKKKRL
jgi:hypothetical protein